jgi:hypothetical protein
MPQQKTRSSGGRARSGTPRAKSRSTARTSANRSGAQRAATKTANKAKVPAIAAGAAAAGLAGGLVLGSRRSSRRKVLGVHLPGTDGLRSAAGDVLKAAETVGSAGRQAGELAEEVRRTRETVQNAKGQSPVEVLLRALTQRRGG